MATPEEDLPEWHPQQEKILKKWSEIGSSYRYLHDKSFQKYSAQNMRFALPVIVISTITGTANFAQGTFPESWQSYVPLGIGTLNLAAGLITTVAQFLRVSELLEGHRAASIAYSKFSRDISVELSLPIRERTTNGREFLIKCRNELDRLIEQSPNVPQKILLEFSSRFANSEFVKPDILEIKQVEVYIDEEEVKEKMQKIADREMKRRRSIIEMEEIKKKEIIDKYTTEKKKIKAKKKQGIGHIQSSMQNLITRLEEGRNLMAPIASFSDSNDSMSIDMLPTNIVTDDENKTTENTTNTKESSTDDENLE